MLTDQEKEALLRWYSEEKQLKEFRWMVAGEEWEELEEHLQMRCLFPLGQHSKLPDYLKNDAGGPLFPTNLNPKSDLEVWRDAIEVGWEVIQREFGLSRDEIHKKIASWQEDDWAKFISDADRRLAERKAKESEE